MKNILYILIFLIILNSTALTAKEKKMKWIDCKDHYVGGKLFSDAPHYFRLNTKDLEMLTKEDIRYQTGNCPSGLHIDFITDTKNLSVRWTLKDLHIDAYTNINTQGGLDLYMRNGKEWMFVKNAAPTYKELTNERVMFTDTNFIKYAGYENTFSLNLPIYEEVESIEIGIDEDAVFRDVTDTRDPIIFYGTSITHGACAGRPGLTYVTQTRYALNENVINFGFGGGGRLDHKLVDLLCTVNAKILVVEPFANMPENIAEERLTYFYNTYRKIHPATPIVFIEMQPIIDRRIRTDKTDNKNIILRRLFSKWKKTDKNIYKLNSSETYSEQNTMDTIHPNDVGEAEMAKHITSLLKKILNNI